MWIMLGIYVNILCNWLILWQNALYLYLGRSKMCLILQGTRFQVRVLKLYKFVQETSEEVLDFKSSSLTASIYRGLKATEAWCSTASSIDKQSIEVFEKQIFNSDFHSIRVYMFGLSFLTILNIYKYYFKGHQRLHESEEKLSLCKLWPKTKFTLVHFSLKKASVFVHHRIL